MKYRIFVNDEPVCATDWLPTAQAGWARAMCDYDAARHGGDVVLLVDGQVAASTRPYAGRAWPLVDDHVVDMRDVAQAVLTMSRAAGIRPQALAQAMTDNGLPTTPSRLKSISTTERHRQSSTSAAEIVAMCYAAMSVLRGAPQ